MSFWSQAAFNILSQNVTEVGGKAEAIPGEARHGFGLIEEVRLDAERGLDSFVLVFVLLHPAHSNTE
jgi:hypothetical protein